MSERPIISDRPGTDWRSLTLLHSWTGSADYKIVDDRVYLRGKVTAGTTTDGTVLFTLPAEPRLVNPITFPVSPADDDTQSSTPPARLEVQADGDVAIYAAGSIQDVSLAGLSWFIGQ